MSAKGYELYADIWSDQPPFYTYLLREWMDCFGYSLQAARRLTALFSGLLLGSLYGLVRRRESRATALLVCGLLLVSSDFMRASEAVMIGLPALALFYLSLLCLTSDGPAATFASATAFGCAVLSKVFVLLYLPILLGRLWFSKERRASRVALWVCGLMTTIALLTLVPGFSFWTHAPQQLWAPHALAQSRLPTSSGLNYLRFDMSIGLVSLLSLLVFWRRLKMPAVLYFLGLCVLAFHRPSWWHHYLLASIPMCWVAGVGISRSVSELNGWRRSRSWSWKIAPCALIACLSLYLLISLPVRVEKLLVEFQRRVRRVPSEVFEAMKRLKPVIRWMATDDPIAAVELGVPLPPDQVVLSTKRFKTGFYSPPRFFDSVLEYQPELVLLSRFKRLRELAPTRLEQDYEVVVKTERLHLYQRKGLGLERNDADQGVAEDRDSSQGQ